MKNKCKMCDRFKCFCYEELGKKLHRMESRQRINREWKREVDIFLKFERTQ